MSPAYDKLRAIVTAFALAIALLVQTGPSYSAETAEPGGDIQESWAEQVARFVEEHPIETAIILGGVALDILTPFSPGVEGTASISLALARIQAAVRSRATVAGGRITGYTRHGLNQAISRNNQGVHPSAILDAVRNPTQITRQVDAQGRTSITYRGQNATVVTNQRGEVVTTYANNGNGVRGR